MKILNMKGFAINPFLLPLKILNFLYFGGLLAVLPYLTVHMRGLGLSLQQTSIIYTILPISYFIGSTFIGILADKLGNYKLLLGLFLMLNALFGGLLLIVPTAQREAINEFEPEVIEMDFQCDFVGGRFLNYSLQSNPCLQCNVSNLLENVTVALSHCASTCFFNNSKIFEICYKSINSNLNICQVFQKNVKRTIYFNSVIVSIRMENQSSESYLSIIKFKHANSWNHRLKCTPDNAGCIVICNASFLKATPCDCKDLQFINVEVTFWVYLALRIVFDISCSIVILLLNTTLVTMIKDHGSDVGKEKIWSVLGSVMIPPISGLLIDICSKNKNKVDFSPVFYTFVGLTTLASIIVSLVKVKMKIPTKKTLRNIKIVLGNFNISLFLFNMYLFGTYSGFLETMLYLFLSDLGISKLVLGLAVTAKSLSAIPVLFLSRIIIECLGKIYVINLAFLFYGIRLVGYSYIVHSHWSLVFETMDVFTFHLMFVAALIYATVIAPKDMLATLQGLMSGSHNGIGRGTGAFIGGFLVEAYGIRVAMRGLGISAFCFGIVNISGYYLISHVKKLPKKEEPTITISNSTILLEQTM